MMLIIPGLSETRMKRKVHVFSVTLLIYILVSLAAEGQRTVISGGSRLNPASEGIGSSPDKGSFNEPTHLPLISIDTYGQTIPDDPKITVWCKVIDNGPGQTNSIDQPATDFDGPVGIEIRGQSSQMFPKKSYSLETRNDTGAGISVSLLDMPAEEDWILYAPYSDKSLLRNALTYYLGSRMGAWQPRFRFCVLYINGEYLGIYMLIEKIKRDADRVDINKLEPFEISGDALTGGYIIKADKYQDISWEEYFVSYPVITLPGTRSYLFTYVYPEYPGIAPEQKTYISQYITDFENVLNSSGFKDPTGGYRRYIDTDSFIDFQIMQELTNNVDGYIFSTYFYKKNNSDGGKLFAGPLWDFDLGYGNVNYSPINLATNLWCFPNYKNKWVMHWWARLMEDVVYARSFSSRWKDIRKGPFLTDSIIKYIDNTILYLGNEINKNFIKWPVLGSYVWPNYYVGSTYSDEVTFLKNWLGGRLQWMDSNISATWISSAVPVDDNMVVFPNPVIEKFTLGINILFVEKVTIEMFDVTGRKIFIRYYWPEAGGFQEVEINIRGVAAGSYVMRVSLGSRIMGSKNIIVLR